LKALLFSILKAIAQFTGELKPRLHYFQWGLIPSWAKDPAIGFKLINARSETASEKPSFRSELKHRRCLIPTNGFYECQRVEGSKTENNLTFLALKTKTFLH
jgi:putative SOS response-associated peptidase YedK